jgi:glycosyltransferase involved in cell wall biosynthesis
MQMIKSEEIKVSAIVSTYNSQQFIRGCLEDLTNQSIFSQMEIIVVDSGSKENEAEIVNDFQKKFENIKYIRTQERETIYASWNRAVKISTGKYITNANTDDRHHKDAFEILSAQLDCDDSLDLVYADQFITDIPNQTFDNATPIGKFTWPEFNFETLLEFCCVGPQPMWRRSLHEKGNEFFNENLEVAGDYDFWLSVANNNFKKINKTLGLYYRSKNSTNKEFQNIKITQLESYSAREKAFQRHIQYYTEEEIIEKINNAITLIYDPCDFILKSNYSGKIFRYLEHKCWIICVLLEKIGYSDLAVDFAKSKIKYFSQLYNLKNYLKSIKSSDCIPYKLNIDHIITTLKFKDIFYLNLSNEDIFYFLNAKISNKTLIKRAFLYQNIAAELLKNNISQDESDYVFFIYGIILCNLKKFIDVKNLFQDIYKNKLGSQRLNKIFEISLTSKNEKQLKIENKDKISVIIPLFNQGHFLDKTIQSIINQTYQNFEIIIVNDGSTDNSLTIANNIQNKFPNHKIILFSHENHGKGFTRNKGVKESSGNYICILDADDMIASTYLETSLQYFESDKNLGWVIPQTFQFGSKHNNLHWTWNYNFIHSLIQCPAPVSAIYRKQIWTEVGGYCETMTDREDWDFWICAGELGWYGKTTDTVEFLYRKHDVRWGERSEINIASKKEIIMRHPWFYKNFSDQQLTSAATFHPTGVFPEHVLDKKAVSLVPNHPVSRQEFTAAMSTIKQLYAERTDGSNSKRRILFYFFKNVHIPILLPLYHALKAQNADADIAFSYLPPSPEIRAGLLPDEVRIIEQAGVPIYATPQEFHPDLTFIADSVYPWVEGCGKLVHVGHGVLSKGQYYTDTPTARREELADLVCVPGKHHQAVMRRIISKPVVATGMCKLDDLFSGKINRASVIKQFGLPDDYRYVLFAPTFNDELSAIPFVKDRIGDVLPDSKTLLIIKLHASTKPEYKEMYRTLPSRDKRVIYADELDITPFLALCDVMISDVSSAMMEFAALDKPVILFNNPGWTSYQNYNPADIEFQWRDIGIQVADLDEMKDAVSRCLEDPGLNVDKRKKYTDLLFANKRDGNAAQRIVKLALSLVEAEQKR